MEKIAAPNPRPSTIRGAARQGKGGGVTPLALGGQPAGSHHVDSVVASTAASSSTRRLSSISMKLP